MGELTGRGLECLNADARCAAIRGAVLSQRAEEAAKHSRVQAQGDGLPRAGTGVKRKGRCEARTPRARERT